MLWEVPLKSILLDIASKYFVDLIFVEDLANARKQKLLKSVVLLRYTVF